MPAFNTVRRIYRRFTQKITDAEKAYDLWASSYDHQPGNLMLDLDEALITRFLETVPVSEQVIADIGCGTGRHWPKILERKPASLTGFDVSQKMLAQLQKKYPNAITHQLDKSGNLNVKDESVNLIVSTLTIAHMPNIETALTEWNRVLVKGGNIIITDYHPVALSKRANRTFSHEGKTIVVRNYVHPISNINELAASLNLKKIAFTEQVIDESMRPYYEKKNALHLYRQFYGTPIIFAIHFKKT